MTRKANGPDTGLNVVDGSSPNHVVSPAGTPAMSIRRSLFWSYGAQAAVLAAGFIGTVFVSRLLGPYDMGVYAAAMAISGILAVLTTFGVQAYVVRENVLLPGVVRAAFTVNALINLLIFVLLASVGWAAGRWFGDARVRTILQLLSIAPLVSIASFVPLALSTREGRFGLISVVNVVRGVSTPTINVVLVATGHGVVSLAISPIIAELLTAAIMAGVRGRSMLVRPTLTGLGPIIRFGVHLVSIGGLAQITTKASDLILGRLLGTAALGIYSRANVLATTLFVGVYGQASGILFVKMSAEMRDTGRIHDTFLRSIQIITALMWPITVLVAILARPVVELLFGGGFRGAAGPLALLMLWQFIAIGFSMNWELFVLRHETHRQIRFEIARSVVGTIGFTLGSLVSISAAALGRVADVTVGYLLYRPHMDRLAGTEPGELERTYAQSGLVTVVTAVPPLLVMLATGWDYRTPIWLIAAALVLSGFIWLATLWRIGHPIADELRLLAAHARSVRRR